MKKLVQLLLVSLLLSVTGCKAKNVHSVVKQSIDQDTIWVFAQINVPQDDGIEDYFYFGKVNQFIFDQIVDGELTSGFIFFRDLRYWGENDTIVKYEDDLDIGHIVFRIEHIVKIDLEKGDPLILRKQKDESE